MTPEAARYLEKSREMLHEAETVLDVAPPKAAGRAAYLAGFHAAQALLFETTGRVFKTHKGVQDEFGRLTKGDPRFDVRARAFLGSTYDLKAIADYESGPNSQVTREQASDAISRAHS